jgi:hypothetical protein
LTKLQKTISEFIDINSIIKYKKTDSLLKPLKRIDSFKLDVNNPFLSGQLIENALIEKIFSQNKSKVLHKVQGEYKQREKEYYVQIQNYSLQKIIRESKIGSSWLFDNYFTKNRINPDQLKFLGSDLFEASYRCLTKPSIDYCFIDVIIDDTIIDIKTDVSSCDVMKYFKQVFMHSILYTSFLRTNMSFDVSIKTEDLNYIIFPIKNVAIYYWRTNEFYQASIQALLPKGEFHRLVDIYSELHLTHAKSLRKILRR